MTIRAPTSIEEFRAQVSTTAAEAIERLTFVRRGASPALWLATIVANREEATPLLLTELSLTPAEVEARCEAAPHEHAYNLHCIAMHVLGLFEEPRAWHVLLDHYAADPALADELSGTTTTETLGPILARCYDGSGVTPLMALIENDTIDAFVRDAFLKAYYGIVIRGRADRAALVAFVSRLLDGISEETDGTWVQILASSAADLKEPSLRAKIESLFDRGLIQGKPPLYFVHIARDDLDWIYEQSDETIEETILRPHIFDTLLEDICNWPWYKRPEKSRDRAEREFDEYWSGPATYVREGPKIGRNDPCPCGSGKKHKKCCLDNPAPGSALLRH